jgi:hypothetical protein
MVVLHESHPTLACCDFWYYLNPSGEGGYGTCVVGFHAAGVQRLCSFRRFVVLRNETGCVGDTRWARSGRIRVGYTMPDAKRQAPNARLPNVS